VQELRNTVRHCHRDTVKRMPTIRGICKSKLSNTQKIKRRKRMSKLSYRGTRFCDELNIKTLDDFLEYSMPELLLIPNFGKVTVKNVLMHLVEQKLGEHLMRVLWTAMMEKVIETNGDISWKC
jgi:DNA-directed RNA polymerase alpha subunit